MDKLTQIRARVMEHKSELNRLLNLPEEDRKSKFVKIETLHVIKAIQKLSGRYVKSGGNPSDLEEVVKTKVKPEDIKVIDVVEVTTAQKRKRGSKKK